MLNIAGFMLGVLSLFVILAPYLILIALAFSGLLLRPLPSLHPGVNLLLTAILAGWLNIKCFTPYVYPACLDIADTLRRANQDAQARNDLRRVGIEPKREKPD